MYANPQVMERLPIYTIIFFLVTILVSTSVGCKSEESVENGKQNKWLPEEENYPSVATDVDDFLKSVNGSDAAVVYSSTWNVVAATRSAKSSSVISTITFGL